MKCDLCGIRLASAVVSMIGAGKSFSRRVCPQCMQRLQRGDDFSFQMALLGAARAQDAGRVCPVCGATEERLCRTGRVGCAACYDAFAGVIEPMVRRMTAVGLAGETEEGREETPADERAQKIAALREDMFDAVGKEDYERAAKLRDEIRALQAEQDGEGGAQ